MLELKRKVNSSSAKHGAARARARPYSGTGEPQEAAAIHETAINQSAPRQTDTTPVLARRGIETNFQTRVPVITGEAHYTGMLLVDGVVSGQLGGSGLSLNVRQKAKPFVPSEPELSGEINFRDMLRVNGHIAGIIYSQKGTLIVDIGAKVDAHVEVAVAVIGGTVNGDIVAHDRIEIGPGAKIYGNIWTRSIAIRDGAIFEGVCRMIEEERIAG
jgi:cytoskeletal protein CcmA (bactofilin family)